MIGWLLEVQTDVDGGMVVARRRLVVAGPGLMEHLMLSFSCSGSQKTRRMTGINLLLLHMRRPQWVAEMMGTQQVDIIKWASPCVTRAERAS